MTQQRQQLRLRGFAIEDDEFVRQQMEKDCCGEGPVSQSTGCRIDANDDGRRRSTTSPQRLTSQPQKGSIPAS
jgi:hypothetical protein